MTSSAFLTVIVEKTCWDIDAIKNLELDVKVFAKVAVLVKEQGKMSSQIQLDIARKIIDGKWKKQCKKTYVDIVPLQSKKTS